MRPWRRRNVAAAGLAALAALAAGQSAKAQAPRSVRIDYEAAPGCPDERTFADQLRARSAKIAVATDGATSVRVRIAARGGRFEGEMTLSEPKGHEAHRRVEGGCGDVTAALALITALALDPTASTASDPEAPASAPPSAPATPSAVAPSPSAPSPPPVSPPKQEPPARPAEPPVAPPRSDSEPLSEADARAHPWGWSIGAHAGLTGGVAPSPLVSVPAFLEVWRRSPHLFAPGLRLRFERADSGAVSAGSAAGGGDFVWTAGSLDLCPIAWAPWRVRVSLCARGEGGTLAASGTGISPARSSTRPWVSVGLVARVRVGVVGSLFLEIEGGAFAPVVRDRFFVEPDATVQRAPAIAAAGAAGVGVTFW